MRAQRRPVHAPGAVATGHYVVVLAPEQTALRDRINAILRAAMRDGPLEADLPQVGHLERRPAASSTRELAGADVAAATRRSQPAPATPPSQLGADRRYLPSLLRAAVDHAGAVVPGDGAGGASGCAIATGRVYGAAAARAAADRVRRGDARHAGAAAALRALLRPGRRWSGCRRSSRRCSASASTTPPTRARSIARARGGAARAARGGADARLQRPADRCAGARAAGVPLRARADDQRLRRAAQGLVAGLGASPWSS